MATKKKYIEGRDHYSVYRRDRHSNGSYSMEYVCKTSREDVAHTVASSLAFTYKFLPNVDFVVRALPTVEHTIGRHSTAAASELADRLEVWHREDIADEIVQTLNPNGRVSTKKVLDVVRGAK